ncbi:ECF-type sigma factor, partial [Singulisphaera rosea]
MNDVTRILRAVQNDTPMSAEELLPLVYDELRKLASRQLTRERAGQTLQPTALVHEAYLRLTGEEGEMQWNGRGHFFGAAALAM